MLYGTVQFSNFAPFIRSLFGVECIPNFISFSKVYSFMGLKQKEFSCDNLK